MGNLLFDEKLLLINRVLAKLIGLNEAIVVQQLHYWIKINEDKKQNFFENRYWTYNSIKSWHENEFSFWSYDTVKRTFKSLEEKGILISGNFNKIKWDKTKWYTINYDKLDEIYQSIDLKRTKDEGQDDPIGECGIIQPIPENTTENTTENSSIHTYCDNAMNGVQTKSYDEVSFDEGMEVLPKDSGEFGILVELKAVMQSNCRTALHYLFLKSKLLCPT